jgi:hypothetical protein
MLRLAGFDFGGLALSCQLPWLDRCALSARTRRVGHDAAPGQAHRACHGL